MSEGLNAAEKKQVSYARKYVEAVKDSQQVEFELETLLVKYTKGKELALKEIYSVFDERGASSHATARFGLGSPFVPVSPVQKV